MVDKLGLYNDALFHLGEGELASLTEDRAPRRVLDRVYPRVLARCLEEGQWNFAIRAVEIPASASIDPSFGFQYAFAKPDDWVRTLGISDGPDISHSVFSYDYRDENGYWWSDSDVMYVRYVSNDPLFGSDLSLWPQTYADYVALELALRSCKRITGSNELKAEIEKASKRAKESALTKDAMNDYSPTMPTGSWVAARSGSGQSWRRRTKGY